jgi:hypothetical protein
MKALMVSQQFIHAVKLCGVPSHRMIARLDAPLQFHPTLLSKWVHRAQPVRQGDARVIALGRLLGLTPEECFEADVLNEDKQQEPAAMTA